MAKTEVRGGQILDGSVDLAADVTGQLPVNNGGTGSNSASGARTNLGAVGLSDTQTLSNKRITKRVLTTTSSGTPTANTDNYDEHRITALAAAITDMSTNLSGTPNDGDMFWISITDNGTARAITWGTKFEASGSIALPTTTVASTRLDCVFVWNSVTSKWRIAGYS